MTTLRFLSQTQITALGGSDPKRALQDVMETVALMQAGKAAMPAESHVTLGTPQGMAWSLPARVDGRFNAAGVKWTAHRPQAQDDLPMAIAMTLLSRADNGQPEALLQSGTLTAARTAAVTALALQHAAPRDIKRVLLLGAGVQATSHLEMLHTLFPNLQRLYCWNRTPEHLDLMLENAGDLPWTVEKIVMLDEALSQPWDALITCTGARSPLIDQHVMQPGRLVIQVGYHEVSFDAINYADKVVVDGWGDYCNTSAKSLFQMYRAGMFTRERVAADLINLVQDGWRANPDDCVYFSSFGLNVFDIALAARIVQEAERQNVGTLLALDLGLVT